MDTSRYMTKLLRENELGKATGLSSGRLNPWDLPEYAPIRQNLATERDVGMNDYVNKMGRSDVEGPAAALGLERYNQGFGNSLLDIVNKMRGGYVDKGLSIGKDVNNEQLERAKLWQQGHQFRRSQPNDFTKITQGIQQGAGAVSSLADLGFGGAAMLGKLPGMNGQSIMAGGQSGGINIQQLMTMLQKILGG
jgi:hypothetical protein